MGGGGVEPPNPPLRTPSIMSQVTLTTVTNMTNCDVITIVQMSIDARAIVACHMLQKNLNGNNCDTLAHGVQ